MLNVKSILSSLKQDVRDKIANVNDEVRNNVQKFKKDFYEVKQKPRSKRKSLLLGFATSLGIFGASFAPALPAVAKEAPKNGVPKLTELCLTPAHQTSVVPSQQITCALSGAYATICALAII